MMPSRLRSSGQRPTPAAMASRGLRKATGLPSMVSVPAERRSAPAIRRSSSERPEPTRPAMPSTSPLCRRKETSRTRDTAELSPTASSLTSSVANDRWVSWLSSRPTISETISFWSTPARLREPTTAPSRMMVARWPMRNTSSILCDT